MTIEDFILKLSKSYQRPVPQPQLRVIRKIVGEELPEHALSAFFEFVLKQIDTSPNAFRVKACLDKWMSMAHPEREQVDAQTYRCPYGICDGTKFTQRDFPESVRTVRYGLGESYEETVPAHTMAYLCKCHAGYGKRMEA